MDKEGLGLFVLGCIGVGSAMFALGLLTAEKILQSML